MKVKNTSKKIIGNGSFRLLPGESLNVSGNEVWVKNYLAKKVLTEVAAAEPEAANSEEQASSAEVSEAAETAEAAEAPAKSTRSTSRKSTGK